MLQSRTPVEKGHWGRGGLFWLSFCQLSICLNSTPSTTNTHLLFLYLSAHLKHTLLHVLSIVFYLSLVLPICCFLFPILLSDHHHYAPSCSPPLLMSSFTPPLHPSNVGGQQNNIQGVMVTGSPLPVVSSCYCPWSYCCLAPALY